jgi:hypothetical protein
MLVGSRGEVFLIVVPITRPGMGRLSTGFNPDFTDYEKGSTAVSFVFQPIRDEEPLAVNQRFQRSRWGEDPAVAETPFAEVDQ